VFGVLLWMMLKVRICYPQPYVDICDTENVDIVLIVNMTLRCRNDEELVILRQTWLGIRSSSDGSIHFWVFNKCNRDITNSKWI